MRRVIVIAALLASAPAMSQNMSQMGNRSNRAFYIPDRWWTDQDQSELRCDRYPDQDKWMRAECIAKIRGAR